MEVENKPSIIIPIISNYDVSKGDFSFHIKLVELILGLFRLELII
jgi:hypothetical protein